MSFDKLMCFDFCDFAEKKELAIISDKEDRIISEKVGGFSDSEKFQMKILYPSIVFKWNC